MDWEKDIKNKISHLRDIDYEDIHQMCLHAFVEGRLNEKALAVEACRLRCRNLFGNKCLDHTHNKKLCDGSCEYLKKFLFELNKLEN